MKYLGVFLTIITKRSILDVAAVIDPPLGQMWQLQTDFKHNNLST